MWSKKIKNKKTLIKTLRKIRFLEPPAADDRKQPFYFQLAPERKPQRISVAFWVKLRIRRRLGTCDTIKLKY